ncbi:MAG: adenylate kinase, partial [Moorea sp. SIO3E2]|nr:adenylate kinase [Moorena sp. SIO3E2]
KEGRTDDNEETIRTRLEVYNHQTAPLVEFYREHSALKSINGDVSSEQVTESIKQVLA